MLDQLMLSAKVRALVYAVYGGLGLVLGAGEVGFHAAKADLPVWLTVATAVYLFLGGAFGYTATTHVPKAPDAQADERLV